MRSFSAVAHAISLRGTGKGAASDQAPGGSLFGAGEKVKRRRLVRRRALAGAAQRDGMGDGGRMIACISSAAMPSSRWRAAITTSSMRRTGEWRQAAPIPRGANHIGVAADAGVIYAFGGFVEENRIAVPDCYAYVVADDAGTRSGRSRAVRAAPFRWSPSTGGSTPSAGATCARSTGTRPITRMPTIGITLAPVPGPRDHTAAVVVAGSISVVGGRMDTFDFNTGMHVVYDVGADRWQERAPMSTPRSGHGGVLYRGKLFCMGGEGTRRVFRPARGL